MKTMIRRANKKSRVQIITGFSPFKLPQLHDMGVPTEPASFLIALAGKDTLRFTIPTIAPAVLASYLMQNGMDVDIIDFYLDDVGRIDGDIVGISSTFMGIEDVKHIADLVRARKSSAIIVLGGPLSWSVSPIQLLQAVPSVDLIVQKEGEQSFLKLIHTVDSGGDLKSVRGLTFRENGTIVTTQYPEPLDSANIPRPSWRLMGIPSSQRLPVLPVETSRGCPYNCAYCSEVTYWGNPVRYRAVDNVIQELQYDVTELGITTFRFTDSCFSAPPSRSAEICDAMYEKCIKRGVVFRWSSYARMNSLDRELLWKMKRSGCIALDIGLESGSVEMLDRMGRNYSPELAMEVAATARELGIIINFNVVIGFPGETKETVQATAELIEQAEPDTYSCFLFFLAPNTRIDANRTQYELEGSGLSWKHLTMTSEEALENMNSIVQNISRSCNFPGGEYFACYLASVGYSDSEIKDFYKAMLRLTKFPADQKAISVVSRAVERVREFL